VVVHDVVCAVGLDEVERVGRGGSDGVDAELAEEREGEETDRCGAAGDEELVCQL
jgi:hypothetical protein